jgi:hypothetical protein
MLQLDWEEKRRPTGRASREKVRQPVVTRDLGENTKLNYHTAGVQCSIVARL